MFSLFCFRTPHENHVYFFSFYRPEAVGVLCGCVYLVCMFLFIPARFGQDFIQQKENFPHQEVSEIVVL